jgi:MOSC domain-containing protein YiiM
MQQGLVVSIHISPAEGQPMLSLEQVHAVPGKGLEGDRYFNATDPGLEITLIEIEAIEDLKPKHGVEIAPADARRNIVTRGVRLNDLVERQFKVGAVTLRGIQLCEPCASLAKITHPKVLRGLLHRGGLRAQIVTEGDIQVGDAIQVL